MVPEELRSPVVNLVVAELPKLEDLGDVSGKRVLVRTDFNVPLDNGEIRDELRIREAIPTLKYLVDNGAVVTACSHLGRPKGKVTKNTLLHLYGKD